MSDSELIDDLDVVQLALAETTSTSLEAPDHQIYSGTGTTPAKNPKCLPVYVVEYHHHAVQHIHRQIARKRLKFDNNAILHFDSHPDLCFPRPFDPDRIFEKEYVYDNVNIESWILPLVYAGHIRDVAWIRPPWADQISDGFYRFVIGNNFNEVKVSLAEEYFLSECLWSPQDFLTNTKQCNLYVTDVATADLGKVFAENREPSKDLVAKGGEWHSSWILDIDLDYFSTKNPFESIFSERQLLILRKLYNFPPIPKGISNDELQELSQRRRDQLDDLQITIGANLHNAHLPEDHEGEIDEVEQLVDELIKDLDENPPHDHVVTPELIHDAGCTMDMRSMLPHHVSSREEIVAMVKTVEEYLGKLPEAPKVVTISRSSTDDYCPKDDVDFIQNEVIDMLHRLYGECNVTRDYDEETDGTSDGRA